MQRLVGLFLIGILFTACGYKPATHYTRDVLGERIHVDVSIDRKDPKNSVLIKDAVNESVITRLGGKLSSKETSDSEIYISIGSITFTPILYNAKGYVTSYKTKVTLKIRYKNKNGNKDNFSTTGEYDFPIAEDKYGKTNSTISDSNRFQAIRYASLDALNEFISRLTIEGMNK